MNIRFGIVGLGNISTRFTTVLQSIQGVEISAVASSNQEKADQFSQRFHIPNAYSTYEDLFLDDQVDIVYIGLTHNLHFPMAQKCLLEGKAVLCEKPLTTCRRDSEDLINLAREKNVLLVEGMWTRFLPAYKTAKYWAQTGLIGDIKLIDASFCFHMPFSSDHRLYNPDLAGGSLFDVGVYPIDFSLGITGKVPAQILGMGSIGRTGVDEFVLINLAFEDDIFASLSCGIQCEMNKETVIYGTTGMIKLDNCFGPRCCRLYNQKSQLIDEFFDPVEDGFAHQIQHIVNLCKNGAKESELMPFRDSLLCAQIIDTLRSQIGL